MTRWAVALGLAVLLTAAGHVPAAAAARDRRPPTPAVQRAPAAAAAPHRALLDRYCVGCHNQRLKTAGLLLDTMSVERVAESTDAWEKVVRKLRAGAMPPIGMPRPDDASAQGLLVWLEGELDRAAAAHPNPGRTEAMHRLNRAEYKNALRDLLALDVDVASQLPSDDSSYGFDNIAGVQRMSPTLIERYLAVAEKTSRLAVGVSTAASTQTFRLAEDLSQEDYLEGLPFGTRGGTMIRHTFPADGEYDFRVQLARRGASADEVPTFDLAQRLQISIDGEPVAQFTLATATGGGDGEPAGKPDANWRARVSVKAGPREVTITFLNRTPALLETLVEPYLKPYPGSNSSYTTRRGAYLRSVEISGPYNATGPGDTPSRRRIFACRPASHAEEPACARKILSGLARRAYRRPLAADDLDALVTFYTQGRTEGTFDAGIARGLQAILMSPHFLIRVERDPPRVPAGGVYAVSDLELASRLSFFLWSSIPDDTLLDLALKGTLRRPAVLEQQVARMLADPRSDALVRNFAGQWLLLRNVPAVSPDQQVDPDFDDGLRQASRRETELLIGSVLHEHRSVMELLTAGYTFVNERLARHYGIPNVKGSHYRRVAVTDDRRRGLLGHASILSVTAFPNRTSPVLRGKWVLENILGTPPPAPPANVPALDESKAVEQSLTMRERIARHRANPVCASCHSMMDPPGLALENFDLVGRWRTLDESGARIDASGVLPDGTAFDGPAGLRDALARHPERFVTTVTEKLLTYALGRGLEPYDQAAVRAIRRGAAGQGYHLSTLVMGIVRSDPFLMRSAQP